MGKYDEDVVFYERLLNFLFPLSFLLFSLLISTAFCLNLRKNGENNNNNERIDEKMGYPWKVVYVKLGLRKNFQ